MKRKLVSIFIVASLVLTCLLGTSAYANIPNGDSGTDKEMLEKVTLESQREDIMDNDVWSVEEKARNIEKINMVENLKVDSVATMSTLSEPNEIYLDIWPSKQKWDNYCGPATTVQTLNYWDRNITTSNQDEFAEIFNISPNVGGTDGLVLRALVNERIEWSGDNYVVVDLNSYSLDQFGRTIFNGLYIWNMPPIFRLVCSLEQGWLYTSSGHFMNASGYVQNMYNVEVTDPYIKWIDPNSSGKYFNTRGKIYNSISAHFTHHFYY